MAKYDQCEHCRRPRREGGRLSTVDSWLVFPQDGRRVWSYYLVCDDCYETRQQWCDNVFPDICAKCGSVLRYAEFFFNFPANCDQVDIPPAGLAADEVCHVICESCHRQKSQK